MIQDIINKSNQNEHYSEDLKDQISKVEVPSYLQEQFYLPPFLPPNILSIYLREVDEEVETDDKENETDSKELDEVPGEQEPLTLSEIGRAIELKKIYSRLLAIVNFLKDIPNNKKIIQIRDMINEALYMFEVIVNNFSQYKDQIDDIIVSYYKFIKQALFEIKSIYKKLKEQREIERNKNTKILRKQNKEVYEI